MVPAAAAHVADQGARAEEEELSEDDAAKRLRDKSSRRMRRPAAASGMKRPAAAAAASGGADAPPAKKPKKLKTGSLAAKDLPKGFKLDLTNFLDTKVAAKYPSKGAYTSKIYAEGGKQAMAQRLSLDDVKRVQKIAYGIASSFWANSGLQ